MTDKLRTITISLGDDHYRFALQGIRERDREDIHHHIALALKNFHTEQAKREQWYRRLDIALRKAVDAAGPAYALAVMQILQQLYSEE